MLVLLYIKRKKILDYEICSGHFTVLYLFSKSLSVSYTVQQFQQSWFVSNYRHKIYRISKAREDKRLAKYSWQPTLFPFRGCVLDLTTNLPQFSLSHVCVITTIPMSDSIIWLFLFNQPSPIARIIVIWAFGFHTATEQSRCRNWILCETHPQDAPVWGCACCLEPVNKWHYNAFCSQLQWLQATLNIFKFNVHGSVYRNNILVYKSQQDAQVTEFI